MSGVIDDLLGVAIIVGFILWVYTQATHKTFKEVFEDIKTMFKEGEKE